MPLYCWLHGHTLKDYICQKCGANKAPKCAIGCTGRADPRCKGGNCTRHCDVYCERVCIKVWARKDQEWDNFVETMTK